MGENPENNKDSKGKKKYIKSKKLWFNIEYCQIVGENESIKYEYFEKNLWLPSIFLIIIFVLMIILAIYNLSQPDTPKVLSDGSQTVFAILTALLTFSLVIFREHYISLNEKIVYFNGFMMEVMNNIEYLNANYETAKFENKQICEGEIKHTDDFGIEPIFTLQFEFWELLKSKMNLKDLYMDIGELEKFFYDSRRCNDIIGRRNDVKLFYEKTALTNRARYNSSILTITKYARTHLFNAIKKRGIKVHFNKSEMKELKNKKTSDFIKFLETEKPEFENITFTPENIEDLEKSFNKKPDELYIYYYDKHGPVNDNTLLRRLNKQLNELIIPLRPIINKIKNWNEGRN